MIVPLLRTAAGCGHPGRSSLDEPVTLWLLVGGALVIGGVAVAQRGPARKAGMPPGACIDGAERQRW